MTVRKQVGPWLAVGVVACVAGWGLRERIVGTDRDARSETMPAVASQAALLRVQGDFSIVGKQQPIVLNAAMARHALRDGVLQVALPDGTTYPVKMERQETDRFGQWSVVGRVRTRVSDAAMVLTFGGDAVFGMLPMPDGRALQIVTNHGRVEAMLAGSMMPPGLRAIANDMATDPVRRGHPPMRRPVPGPVRTNVLPELRAAASTTTTPVAQAATPVPQAAPATLVNITLALGYGDDLIALRGSEPAVQTDLSNLVAIANQTHIDSGSRVRLQLVGTQKLAIAPTMSNSDALYAMTVAPIGSIDTEAVRNSLSADLFAFVRPFADYENCGIAWVGGAGLHGTVTSSLLAYSVVAREPCGPMVLAHEVGHNLGAAHDRQTERDNPGEELQFGAFPYSFGWRGASGWDFATVMAYNTRGEAWLGLYSTPLLVTCNKAPCGVAEVADNVRTFDRMAVTVSEFRRTPGSGGISDTEAWQTESSNGPGNAGFGELRFPIRLSVAPGSSGASVDVAVVSGSQYINGTLPTRVYFGPFQQDGLYEVPIAAGYWGDVEPQVVLKLSNAQGFVIEDDTAVGTWRKVNRIPVRGRFVLPEVDGTWIPMSASATGGNGPRDEGSWGVSQLFDPREFAFGVVPGSSVDIRGSSEARYIARPLLLQNLLAPPPSQDIRMVWSHQISGRVLQSNGYPFPVGIADANVRVITTWKGRVISDGQVQPSNFGASVLPGSTIEIIVNVPSTFLDKPYYFRRVNVGQDEDLTVRLSPQVAAFLYGGRRLREGEKGQRTIIPFGIQLTAPAPAGGGSVAWGTVDGTAKAGADYIAASGTVTFAEGETFKQVGVEIIGDNAPEPDEWFEVHLSSASGLGLYAPIDRVDIAEDEAPAGGPSRPVPVDE